MARSKYTLLRAVRAATLAAYASLATLGCGAVDHEQVTVRVDLGVRRYQLENGLRVMLMPEPSMHAAGVSVYYRVGSADEAQGEWGLAHLLEHLTFRARLQGQGRSVEEAWSRAVGASFNASTSREATTYYGMGRPNDVRTMLFAEARRMADPLGAVQTDAFDVEREVVLNELRQRYESTPYAAADETARDAAYAGYTQYAHPIIGTTATLRAQSLGGTQAFARRYYQPANATLVITGEFNEDLVRRWVAGYYGPIVSGSAPAAQRAAPSVASNAPLARAQKQPIAMVSGERQPYFAVGLLLPGRTSAGFGAAQILAAVLPGLLWLDHRALYTRHDEEFLALASTITFGRIVQPGEDREALMASFRTALEELPVRLKYAARVLANTRSQEMNAQLLALELPLSRAQHVHESSRWFNLPDRVQADLRVVQDATDDEVRALAETLQPVFVTVDPRPGAPSGGTLP